MHSTTVHVHFIEIPAAISPTNDADIASFAQQQLAQCIQTQPHDQHAVILHPTAGTVARTFLASPQASGWLYSPLHQHADAPIWQTYSVDVAQAAAAQAIAKHFCAADAAILAVMGALASIDAQSATLPSTFTQSRRHFPLLGTPRTSRFATMPASFLTPSHPHRLYAVMGDADWVIRCMQAGVRLVQLRLKNADGATLTAQIQQCAQAAARYGAMLIINDHWQAALRHIRHSNTHGIYGIHMGQEDLALLSDDDLDTIHMAGLRLGLSTHSLWELSRALRTQPSHIACGPVHATTTKQMPWRPLGDANVAWWAHLVHQQAGDFAPLPLVAIGGMNPDRALAAAAAGADCVAVVSDITGAANPESQIATLVQAITAGHAQRQDLPDGNWPVSTLPPC